MALTDKLIAIGDAIRDKTGETAGLTLDQMVVAIGSIEGREPVVESIEITENGVYEPAEGVDGYNKVFVEVPIPESEEPVLVSIDITENGTYTPTSGIDGYNEINVNVSSGGGDLDIPDYAFNLTGDLSNRFYADSWSWFINQYGKQMTATNITNLNATFSNCALIDEIPFDIYMDPSKSNHNLKGFYALKVKKLPYLYNAKPDSLNMLLQSCSEIEEIPQDWCDTWDFSYINNQTSAYSGGCSDILASCSKLERFPMKIFENGNPVANYSTSIYYHCFSGCYSLNEVLGVPFPHTKATWTSNAFNTFAGSCMRLSRLTFKTHEDGSPYVVNWKSQTLDLSSNLGYADSTYERNNFLSKTRFTTETEVKDDTTYQALKDNPDWWSSNIAYCRYGHASAVETINTLPDTSAYLASAGGTNTIRFKKNSGKNNDDGGVAALTEEEIAVAAAKGWTVAYTSY